jgi:oligopeptide transport system permease protein
MRVSRWEAFFANWPAFVAAGLLSLFVLTALIGPPLLFLHNHCGYATQDLTARLQPPTWKHLFGTDTLGRDILIRLLYGFRISMFVGLVASLIAVVIGAVYGSVAGYFGGSTDYIMMRLVDVIYAFPILILLVIVFSLFERNLALLMLSLCGVSWLGIARIVRGQVLMLRNGGFIDAARLLRASPAAILRRHILPNAAGPLLISATFTVPGVILGEAFLSYLGLGVQPPLPSLGTMVNDGAQVLALYPRLLLGPAILLILSMVCLNLLGDGLRDVLDPRSRKG